MRKFIINVNGNSYEVEVEEVGVEQGAARVVAPVVAAPVAPATKSAPAPAPKAAPKVEKEVTVSAGQEVIEAPMPGNIWKVLVKEGDTVKSGDVLLILEAMKMENEILAPKDGVIANINATEGSTVNTGDKLVVID